MNRRDTAAIIRMYCEEMLGAYLIARVLNVTPRTVYNALEDAGITLRTMSQAALRRMEREPEHVRRRTTHGLADSRTYRTWVDMRRRCSNPDRVDYHLYGGRGITVCARWRDSFENFLADMGERPVARTLDRKDVNGHYEKENCRWATSKEQAANKRRAGVI